MEIYFQELTNLQPTIISTVLKLVEEAGELSREVLHFRPYLEASKLDIGGQESFGRFIGELLDVGQTTATLAFCLQKTGEVDLGQSLQKHLEKLRRKGYAGDDATASIEAKDGKLSLTLPRLDIDADIVWTCIKISEEAGELVQAVGKKSGMSGEASRLGRQEVMEAVSLELLDVAQCCVTMLYILVDEYGIEIASLLDAHATKLREHGYL